jgi:hypothetical protein
MELSILSFCDIAGRAIELGLIVLDEKEFTHQGADWTESKKPTLTE